MHNFLPLPGIITLIIRFDSQSRNAAAGDGCLRVATQRFATIPLMHTCTHTNSWTGRCATQTKG